MPLKLAYCRGAMLRTVRSNVFSRPTRVAAIHTPVRSISLATTGRVSIPLATSVLRPSVYLPKSLVNSFATAKGRGRPKGTKGGKTKAKSGAVAKSKKAKKPRELTEKQKAKQEASKRRELVKQLKITALTPPEKLPQNPRGVGVQMKYPEVDKSQPTVQRLREVMELVNSMSPEERERAKATAESNKAANADAYEKWLKRHTPLQIRQANIARRRLAAVTGRSTRTYPLLQDERLVKRPRGPFQFFFRSRAATGDFGQMSVLELSTRVGEEWNGMTDGEKEMYRKQAAEDTQRYRREYRDVYGEEPKSSVMEAKAKAKAKSEDS